MGRQRVQSWMAAVAAAGLVLSLPLAADVGKAAAGEARAQFRVGLRIVPPSPADAATSATVAATPAAAARPSRSTATTPRRLPRADGSGWCVRVALGGGRWRWQCR